MSEEKRRLSPMFLVEPGSMSARDIRRAEKACGIVILECTNAELGRYAERPIEAVDIDEQAYAALALIRLIAKNDQSIGATYSKGELLKHFVSYLMDGHRPKPVERTKNAKG